MCASAPRGNRERSYRKYAFPRRLRLLNADDFQRVFAKPYRSSDPLFTVLARQNPLGFARIGLAISRKVAPKAHQRNRLKRMIGESFRVAYSTLPGVDIVIMARPGAISKPNPVIQDSLTAHWQQLVRRCADSSS